MQLKIQTLDNTIENLEIDENATYKELCEKVSSMKSFGIDTFKIVYNGCVIKATPDIPLKDLKLVDNSKCIIFQTKAVVVNPIQTERPQKIVQTKKIVPTITTFTTSTTPTIPIVATPPSNSSPLIAGSMTLESPITEEMFRNLMRTNSALFMNTLMSDPNISAMAANNPAQFNEIISSPEFIQNVINIGNTIVSNNVPIDTRGDHRSDPPTATVQSTEQDESTDESSNHEEYSDENDEENAESSTYDDECLDSPEYSDEEEEDQTKPNTHFNSLERHIKSVNSNISYTLDDSDEEETEQIDVRPRQIPSNQNANSDSDDDSDDDDSDEDAIYANIPQGLQNILAELAGYQGQMANMPLPIPNSNQENNLNILPIQNPMQQPQQNIHHLLGITAEQYQDVLEIYEMTKMPKTQIAQYYKATNFNKMETIQIIFEEMESNI
jgi:hypothetical protein